MSSQTYDKIVEQANRQIAERENSIYCKKGESVTVTAKRDGRAVEITKELSGGRKEKLWRFQVDHDGKAKNLDLFLLQAKDFIAAVQDSENGAITMSADAEGKLTFLRVD